MRTSTAWLVTLPIALAGIEAAHAVANRAFGSPEGAGELFAGHATGSELVAPLIAIALAAVLVGLGGLVAGSRSTAPGARSVAVQFACLPPVAFVLLELVEAGGVSWDAVLEPAFLAGLLLQGPFALAGYLVARLLIRLSDGVRALVGRRRPAPPLAGRPAPPVRANHDRRFATRRRFAQLGRAPPAGHAASS